MTYVEYKQLNPFQRFSYNTKKFFCNIPLADAYEELNYCLAECFKKMGNGMRNVTEKLLCVVGKSLERIELFVFNICH